MNVTSTKVISKCTGREGTIPIINSNGIVVSFENGGVAKIPSNSIKTSLKVYTEFMNGFHDFIQGYRKEHIKNLPSLSLNDQQKEELLLKKEKHKSKHQI